MTGLASQIQFSETRWAAARPVSGHTFYEVLSEARVSWRRNFKVKQDRQDANFWWLSASLGGFHGMWRLPRQMRCGAVQAWDLGQQLGTTS